MFAWLCQETLAYKNALEKNINLKNNKAYA